MKPIINSVNGSFALLGSSLYLLLGGFDQYLYALLGLVLADYISGLVLAIQEKRISSQIGFMGILKKMLIFLMVGMGHLLDRTLLSGGEALRTGIIFFYAANEGISIIENLSQIGFPIPEKLKKVLIQIKEREE